MASTLGTILDFAQIALGVGSLIQNRSLASEASQEANRVSGIQENIASESLGIERAKLAQTQQVNQAIQALANTAMEESADVYDGEMNAMTRGILQAALKGTQPIEMLPFQSYFNQIDQAAEMERRRIRESNQVQVESLARQLPPGGARIRILAELARTLRDSEAEINAKAANEKKTQNQTILKELFDKGLAYGTAEPDKRMDVLKTVSNMLNGLQQPSSQGTTATASIYDTELQRAISAGQQAQQGSAALGTLLGTVSGRIATDEKATADAKKWDDYLKAIQKSSGSSGTGTASNIVLGNIMPDSFS